MITTAATANEILDAEINCLAALNESDLADYLQWMDGVHAQVPDPEPETEDDETQYLRSLAGSAPIFIDKDDSVGGRFELFPEYEN
jgi:hypothetical protein